MSEVWKSKDLTVELGPSSTAGVYSLAVKSPHIGILNQGTSQNYNRVVERSIGVEKYQAVTTYGLQIDEVYKEKFPRNIPEGMSDYTLYGYFASWAKKVSFDEDSKQYMINRNWVLNKSFNLKYLGQYDPISSSDEGLLTTGGYKFYKDDGNACLRLYNTEDGELFDYILSRRTANEDFVSDQMYFYGKDAYVIWNCYDGSGSTINLLDTLNLNNRDEIQDKLTRQEWKLGIFGTYTKGSESLAIESTVLPEGLPDVITGYSSLKEYVIDQLSKYQISESDIDFVYVAMYEKSGNTWTKVVGPDSWYLNLKCGENTVMWYVKYGESHGEYNPVDKLEEFFKQDLEVRLVSFSGYPQFQIGPRTVVKFKEKITPFSSKIPYDSCTVDNFQKISDDFVQFDVTIKGLSAEELDATTTFSSTVKRTEIKSFRPEFCIGQEEYKLLYLMYNDGEHPYTTIAEPNSTTNRDKIYLQTGVNVAIFNGHSINEGRDSIFGEPTLGINTEMSSDQMFFPFMKTITMIAPYQEHLDGTVNITRNGDAVGSEDVDQLDYRSTFTYERINNDVDVDASYSIITTVIEDEVPRAHFDTTNATLKARFYDHTRIKFSDNSGMVIDPAEALRNMTINVTECLGANRKSVTFNMATRNILVDGVETGETCDDFIFYDTFLTYNTETQQYEMSIYIAARCGFFNEHGFNDSIVTVTYNSVRDGEVLGTSTLKYRTVLPPFILQGVPYKQDPDEADSVFPNAAQRPDIGYDAESDSYVIPSYAENSQGYDRDFFFAARQRNAEIAGKPLYLIPTSGFLTSELAPNYEFSDCDAYLVNDATESKIRLEQESMTVHENVDTVEVMTQPNTTYCGTYNVIEWNHRVEAPDRGFYKNVATVSAAVVERSINN